MPTAANSDIDVAARALVLIGADPITSFTASSTEALVANNVYEDTVRTALCATDILVADFTYRAGEQSWPSYFTLAVEYGLAATFALGIARDEQMASMFENKAARLMQPAKTLDSQQQTTRKLVTSRFISERRS